ncbi:hypothetical protein ACLESD_29730 [Pyxidicoccus sp. 3LFB2]
MGFASIVVGATLLASPPEPPPHLAIGVGTDFPLDVAAFARFEGPGRLRLTTSLGWMPRAYSDTLNTTLVELGAYDELTGELLSASLNNALVWRTHVGWRPFPRSGFFFSGGYTLVTLGGDLTGAEAISAATGREVPPSIAEALDVSAASTLHQASAELGWRWSVGGRFGIEAVLGGFYTFSTSTQLTLESGNARFREELEPLLVAGEDYLDDTLGTYAHAGYVGLRFDYELF